MDIEKEGQRECVREREVRHGRATDPRRDLRAGTGRRSGETIASYLGCV